MLVAPASRGSPPAPSTAWPRLRARPRAGRRWSIRWSILWALLAAAATGAEPARADIRIDVDGVDGDLRRNVLAFLSLERYRDRDRLQEDTVMRLFERANDEVRLALRPFGYYEPQIRSEINEDGADWRVRLLIEPGEPVIVQDVRVQVHGAGAEEPAFESIVARPVLRKGDRLSHASYEQMKGALQRTAAANGYLDARLLQNEMLVDREARTASIRLELETGDQYRFGEVAIEQDVIDHDLMRRFLRFRAGEPFNALALLRTQFALDDSLYFSQLEVLPLERDVETRTVPVRIQAQKSRRFYSLGAGYGTDTGIRGTLGWTDPRINRKGHRFRAEIRASDITRSIDSRYDIPIGDPALEKISVEGIVRTEDLSDFLTSEEYTLRPSVTQMQDNWQRVLSLALTNVETTELLGRNTSTLLVPGISFASVPEGYLGEALFSRGVYAELIGSHEALGSDSAFLRLHVQLERVLDLVPGWHLLLRGELGTSVIDNFEELPGIYRFFAGGDRSVRGFGYNDLSPIFVGTQPVTQPDGSTTEEEAIEKTGGRHLLVGSVEIVRDLPRNFAVASFFDIGNAFNRFGDPMAYSVGVGIRFRLPVVTMGLDVAQPLSESGSPRLHLNISPKL